MYPVCVRRHRHQCTDCPGISISHDLLESFGQDEIETHDRSVLTEEQPQEIKDEALVDDEEKKCAFCCNVEREMHQLSELVKRPLLLPKRYNREYYVHANCAPRNRSIFI